jgi:hypothetical protein
MKNIKFLIIGIVVLILLGSGYFLSKIFFKDEVRPIEMPKAPKEKKVSTETTHKPKAKTSKKSKVSTEL